jgi:hypothetical protein
MSWSIQITVATAASGGDVPISDATIKWTDAEGAHEINNSSAFSPSNPDGTVTATVMGPSSVTFTASCAGFESGSMSGSDGGGPILIELAMPGSGGGSSGGTSTGGCFIVTAAYGAASAPEVKFLQGFRDNVLRRTRWGHQFFDDLWKHYYRISPAISEEMRRDPELRRVMRWGIVEPWINYMKLMMARPDLHGMKLEGLDPKLRAFLRQFEGDADKWLKSIEPPKSFAGRAAEDAVHELNIILGLVLLRTDGRAYLDDLEKRGELPLRYPQGEEAKLRAALVEAGRTEDEVASILYGARSSRA